MEIISTNYLFWIVGSILIMITNIGWGKLISNKFLNLEVKNIFEDSILGFLTISTIGILINFIFPISDGVSFVVISIGLISFLINANWSLNKQAFFLFLAIITYTTLRISSTTPTFDFGLYHMSQLNWIEDSKIVFGLVNIHSRFGYGSSLFYYLSIFRVPESYFLFSSLALNVVWSSGICLAFFEFFNSKSKDIYYSNFSLFTGTLLLLTTKFGTDFTNTDGIPNMLAILSILFYLKYKRIENSNLNNFVFLILITGFTITTKISTFPIIFFVLCEIYFLKKRLNYKKVIIATIPVSLWLIKNFIISSCLVFPVNITCLYNTKFSFGKDRTLSEASKIRDYAYEILNINNINDLTIYVIDNYLLNTVFSLLLIMFIFQRLEKFSFAKSEYILFVSCFLGIFMFFVTGPDIRFHFWSISGVVLLLLAKVDIFNKSVNSLFNNSIRILLSIVFLSIITIIFPLKFSINDLALIRSPETLNSTEHCKTTAIPSYIAAKYKLASIGITKPLHLRFDDNSEANLDIPNNNCEGYFISSSVVISEDVYKGGNTTFLNIYNKNPLTNQKLVRTLVLMLTSTLIFDLIAHGKLIKNKQLRTRTVLSTILFFLISYNEGSYVLVNILLITSVAIYFSRIKNYSFAILFVVILIFFINIFPVREVFNYNRSDQISFSNNGNLLIVSEPDDGERCVKAPPPCSTEQTELYVEDFGIWKIVKKNK